MSSATRQTSPSIQLWPLVLWFLAITSELHIASASEDVTSNPTDFFPEDSNTTYTETTAVSRPPNTRHPRKQLAVTPSTTGRRRHGGNDIISGHRSNVSEEAIIVEANSTASSGGSGKRGVGGGGGGGRQSRRQQIHLRAAQPRHPTTQPSRNCIRSWVLPGPPQAPASPPEPGDDDEHKQPEPNVRSSMLSVFATSFGVPNRTYSASTETVDGGSVTSMNSPETTWSQSECNALFDIERLIRQVTHDRIEAERRRINAARQRRPVFISANGSGDGSSGSDGGGGPEQDSVTAVIRRVEGEGRLSRNRRRKRLRRNAATQASNNHVRNTGVESRAFGETMLANTL